MDAEEEIKQPSEKGWADRVMDSFISKKLTVFVVACIFVYLGKIAGTEWVNLAMIYIGSQAAIDGVAKLRG